MNQIISYYVWEFGVILGGVAFMCFVRSLHSKANKIRITDETTEHQIHSIVFPETIRPTQIDEFGLDHAEDKATLSKNPKTIIWNGYVYSGADSIRRKTFEKTSNDMLIIGWRGTPNYRYPKIWLLQFWSPRLLGSQCPLKVRDSKQNNTSTKIRHSKDKIAIVVFRKPLFSHASLFSNV